MGAAVSIGSTLYSRYANKVDKRKARKELRSLANRYGVAYNELNSFLYDYYKKNAGYEDLTNNIESLLEDKSDNVATEEKPSYTPYNKSRDDTYNEYVDALKNVVGYDKNTNAVNEAIDKNQNVYANAMSEFEAERDADYKTYQDKIDEYKKFLNNAISLNKTNYANTLSLQDYNNKYTNNTLATLANLQAAGMQTQNQLLSQANGI